MTLTRRELFEGIGALTLTAGTRSIANAAPTMAPNADPAKNVAPTHLPDTEPLTREGDLAAQMVGGIHAYLLQRTAASVKDRQERWRRDYASHKAYDASVAA